MYSDIGPFSIIPAWLLDTPISPRALKLYAVLGRYADKEGKAFPSRRTLATRVGCSMDTIDRAIAELVDAGALDKVTRTENGSKTSSEFMLRLADPKGAAPMPRGSRTSAGRGSRTDAASSNETQTERKDEAIASSGQTAPVRRQRAANVLFDSIAEATGANPDSESGRVAAALNGVRGGNGIRQFVEKDFGERPPLEKDTDRDSLWNQAFRDEVFRRAALYRERWPNVDITPTALRDNWHRIATPIQRVGSGLSPEQIVSLRREDL